MRPFLLALTGMSCALALACGSTTSTGSAPAGGSPGADGGPTGTGGSGSGSGSSGGDNPGGGGGGGGSGGGGGGGGTSPDGGEPAGSFTVQFGPIQVPPSTEKTQCVIKRLGNDAPIHVGQIHNVLGTSSHHMIVYKINDTTEQPTPFDCQPFQDALNPSKGSPLIISQKKDDLLTMPPNVAVTLDAHQMIRLEMHYINTSPTQTATLTSTSTMIPLADADYKYDSAFLFIGDINIKIPPMSTYSLNEGTATDGGPPPPDFFQLPAQYQTSNFWSFTGHEHQWGTKVQIWSAQSASDPGTLEYTNTNWSDPVTTPYAPPLRIPAGGGFKYQCTWNNLSSTQVNFGESANAEMCFFWAYYWPSQGARVCLMSAPVTGLGLPTGTVCCPADPADVVATSFCNSI